MADYFYSTDGRTRLGPVNSRQLKQLADEGTLAPNALIWKEGLPDWIPAERLKGLFPGPAAAAAGASPAAIPPATEPGPAAGYALDAPQSPTASRIKQEPRAWWYMREGQQTGPITKSALIDLVSNLIVSSDTLVWTEGMSEWGQARKVRELSLAASSGAEAAPPVTRPHTGSPRTAVSSARPDPALRWLIPVGRSPWAVVSGYCGLLGLFPLCGAVLAPAAIITGIAAIVHLRRRRDLTGLPRAITGIVLGVLGTAVSAVMIVAMALDAP